MPQAALQKIVSGQSLTRDEARQTLNTVMQGRATTAQIGALLVGLRMKGETAEELTGFVQAMRSHAVAVRARTSPLLDTCGTGGSAFRVFNVSTAAAFVAAAAGIAVAKHGNRAMSGTCGSADVLEALGVKVVLTPEQCADCIDSIGICFLFAQRHHPAMKEVSAPRREIGIRSIFNLLGPLTNPAGATFQVMGVYDGGLTRLAADALRELGSDRALVLHGEIGLDEISTIGNTRVSELRNGEVRDYVLSTCDLGLTSPRPCPADLAPAKTPQENAEIVRTVLGGVANGSAIAARRDLVAVNAAAALRVRGIAESWPEAVRMAREILESGAALRKLEQLIEFTGRLPAV